MKSLRALASIGCGFVLALPLQAHRTTGLLQASLVEVQPNQVDVEVTLSPGSDMASRVVALLDRDHDGFLSRAEADAWVATFLGKQTVTVDGLSIPVKFQTVDASPLSEMDGGHSHITVHYTAGFGDLPEGPHTVVCSNRYEPFDSLYQCNGLLPKSPGVRISHHRRADAQRELILTAEFSGSPNGHAATPISRRSAFVRWFLGLGLLGMVVGTVLFDRTFRNPA